MSGLMGVEPRHLSALLAVHREGSFRGAAATLGLVQSTISQRIVQLERLVGMRLIERSRGQGSLRLTDTGSRLVEHGEAILAEFDAAWADLRGVCAGVDSALRVGAYESVSGTLVVPAVKHMAAQHPDVRVSLHEDTSWTRLFPRVSSGELDAAFADLPLEQGPFASRELVRDPCVLVVAADSPLARRRQVPTLGEIAALPLIAPSWPMLRLIGGHLRAAGVQPSFVLSSQSNAGVQELVAQGAGAALMPRMAVNAQDPRIVIIGLDGALPPRRIALYWHRDRRESSALMSFLDALEAACRELRPDEPRRQGAAALTSAA